MTVVLHELHQAARSILARPAFSALVVGVLAAGLACVVFMLALLNGFLIRPLPFPEPYRLMQAGIHGDGNLGDVFPVTNQDLIGIRRHLDGKADVAGAARSTMNLSDLDRPERYNGAHVSANLFRVLGVSPILGRDFSADDEKPSAPSVAMLSYELWRNRYGGDPGVVGRSVRVDAHPATVIGVMPKDFSYPRREAIWTAATLAQASKPDEYAYWVVLRRHADAGAAAVGTAFAGWFDEAAHADPERFRGLRSRIEPLSDMVMDRTSRAMLGYMLVAVFMVLLIACANAANLLSTHTLSRGHEIAVRVALGASRSRMIVHLFAQSLLLSLIATAIALLLARAGLAWQQAALRESEFTLSWLHFDIDATVVLLALGAALITAIASGILPALQAAGAMPMLGLREGARNIGGSAFARVSRVLVVGEVALSCALVICVGTLVRGINALEHADLGIDTQHLLTARIFLPTRAYPNDADQLRIYDRIGESLRADPSVVDATVSTALPGTFYNEMRDVLPAGSVPGDAANAQTAYVAATDDRFLGAYGVRLQEGRYFDSRDITGGARVAVVDRRFADRYGEGKSVVGRQFRLDPRDANGATVTVVGVIGSLMLDAPGSAPPPTLLVPLRQAPFHIASIAVRTRGDAGAFGKRLTEIMRDVDADTPLYWVRDYAAVMHSMSFGERIVAQSFGLFGGIALALAAAGLYGVMAFAVGQRTREIGVRRALGAPRWRVLRSLFARNFTQFGIGLALGLAAGIPFAHFLSGSLRTIEPGGLPVIASALIVLAGAAMLAVIVPARRALAVDPMVALRNE